MSDEDNNDGKDAVDENDDNEEGFGMEGNDGENEGDAEEGEGDATAATDDADADGEGEASTFNWQNLSMIQRQYLLQLLGAVRGDEDDASLTFTPIGGHRHATRGSSRAAVPDDDDEAKQGEEKKEEVLTLPEDKESLHEYAHRFRLNVDTPTSGNAFSLLKRHTSRPIIRRTANREPALSRFIPNECTGSMEFGGKTFCGKFAADGSSFAVAAQDEKVRIYDTAQWKLKKEINVADMGWSIVDIDYSPDGRFVAYSSWSEFVHVCNVDGKYELHEGLDLQPAEQGCFFGLRFAPQNNEMLAGGSSGYGILFDIERKKRVWIHQGHKDDVNSVTWIDTAAGLPGQLFATASDDCLTKVWDRRLLRSSDGKSSSSGGGAVGGFIGHSQGLTSVSSLGDGRYILTNSKDQSMKLWDLRKMNSVAEIKDGGNQRQGRMDYRWQRYARSGVRKDKDHSLMTYLGHSVVRTLIRCGFSPASTNQQYVYSGSFDGACYVYHAVTGKIAAKLGGHSDIVRDVSWHPHRPTIITSSWDETCRRFDYHGQTHGGDDSELDAIHVASPHDDDDDDDNHDHHERKHQHRSTTNNHTTTTNGNGTTSLRSTSSSIPPSSSLDGD